MQFQKKHKSFSSSVYFILLTLVLLKLGDYCLNILFSHLVPHYYSVKGGFNANFKNSHQTIITFFNGVLFGPFIETAFFQYFIIKFLKTLDNVKKNEILIIMISSLLFGLSHYYSVYYIMIAFLIGIVLAYSFIVSENFKIRPFWIVFSIHCLFNLMSFLIGFYRSLGI